MNVRMSNPSPFLPMCRAPALSIRRFDPMSRSKKSHSKWICTGNAGNAKTGGGVPTARSPGRWKMDGPFRRRSMRLDARWPIEIASLDVDRWPSMPGPPSRTSIDRAIETALGTVKRNRASRQNAAFLNLGLFFREMLRSAVCGRRFERELHR